MNVLEDKIIDWSQQEFNIKVQSKDSLNFLRSKNGNTFKKLMTFMSVRIKSKENGEKIKRFCESIDCRNNLKIIGKEIEEIELKINEIRIKLLSEELKRKTFETKESLSQNKEFLLTLILNAIENISTKNKLFTQLEPNIEIIDETIASYENLFSIVQEFSSNVNKSCDETKMSSTSLVLNHNLEVINQLKANIDSILYHLSQLKVNKSVKLNTDLKSLSNTLFESINEINVKLIEENKQNSGVTSKVVSVQNIMTEYQTMRSEKLSKNKEKLQKIIDSCDELIKQNV